MTEQLELFDTKEEDFDPWKDIVAFHEKFGLEYKGQPRELEQALCDFRVDFLDEELTEYISAYSMDSDYKHQRLEQMFDALIDLVYVAMGTAYLHGFDFPEGWRRVHAANMAKVRAERASDSKRGTTFDVVKPEGWKSPDLLDLVIGEDYSEV